MERISSTGDTGDEDVAAPPTGSNPLSGDESWEASSPESLSPNAPIDDFDDNAVAIDDPFASSSSKKGLGVAGADALLLDTPDEEVESGFAELSAANAAVNAQMPPIEGDIESKEYRALAEMSSGR